MNLATAIFTHRTPGFVVSDWIDWACQTYGVRVCRYDLRPNRVRIEFEANT
jgi:hypothetical protein